MKRLIAVVITALVTASILACSAKPPAAVPAAAKPGGNLAVEAVMKVEEEFRRAKLTNDVAALRRILSDDYTGTNQNSNTRNKAQMLELWETFRITSLTTESSSVILNEDHTRATVTGEQTEENATGTDRMRFQRVYVLARSGEWRLLSANQERR